MRILHVVGSMHPGGIETWLMHVLRRIDRSRYAFDFLTHTTKPCFYDEEIRSLGSRVIPCLHPTNPCRYAWNFIKVLKEYGPYDAIHSHVHHFSGFPLLLARMAGVPMRVAHSHNNLSLADQRGRLRRQMYLRGMKWLIRSHATRGLACSPVAAAALYGQNWGCDPRWRVLHCGVDLEPFTRSVDRSEVRRELGIPADAFVVGHVGRFSDIKNHVFIVDIFADVVRRVSDAVLLLVGEGPLRPMIEEKSARLGLGKSVFFAGARPDVPRLLQGAMDAFLFPSLYEGLGLALVEAQAAGLPCIYSVIVPKEADLVPALLHRLSLKQTAGEWADRVVRVKKDSRMSSTRFVDMVASSPFNITYSIRQLESIYGY